jgi:hypothetical protein
MATAIQNENQYIDAFLKLTLRPTSAADVFPLLISLTPEQRQDFIDLADSNHVVIRAFEVINRVAGNLGANGVQAWAVEVLSRERARIGNALTHLEQVCNALEEEDCPSVVMKSLDHWPDLGNDLIWFLRAKNLKLLRFLPSDLAQNWKREAGATGWLVNGTLPFRDFQRRLRRTLGGWARQESILLWRSDLSIGG